MPNFLKNLKLSNLSKIFIGLIIILIVISAILNVLLIGQKYVIISATQIPPTQKADIYQQFDIVFNKPITANFLKSCQTTISPQIATQLTYKNSTISLVPQNHFDFDTNYQLTVSCQTAIFQTTFLTVAETDLSQQSIQNLQSEKDFQTSQSLKTAFTEKPWLQKLPIVQKDFSLVYDETRNSYLVTTTLPPKSPKTQNDIQAEVSQALKTISAPELPIVWQ